MTDKIFQTLHYRLTATSFWLINKYRERSPWKQNRNFFKGWGPLPFSKQKNFLFLIYTHFNEGGGGAEGEFFFRGGVNRNKKQPGNSTCPVKYDRVIHQKPFLKKRNLFYFSPKKIMLQGRAATFGAV